MIKSFVLIIVSMSFVACSFQYGTFKTSLGYSEVSLNYPKENITISYGAPSIFTNKTAVVELTTGTMRATYNRATDKTISDALELAKSALSSAK